MVYYNLGHGTVDHPTPIPVAAALAGRLDMAGTLALSMAAPYGSGIAVQAAAKESGAKAKEAEGIIEEWAGQFVKFANRRPGEIVKDTSPFTLKPW